MPRRVYITGLGCVSGLGVGIDALWEGLRAGRSAIAPIARFDASGFPWRLAAEVKDFAARDFVPKSYRKAVKVMCRDIELAVGAAHLAIKDAGLVTRASAEDGPAPLTYPSDRIGCHIGAGLIAADPEELAAALSTARCAADAGRVDLDAWGSTGMDNLTPLWLLKYLPNMPACHVTIIHGAEGPSNTITCDEASGLLSIGESTRVIQRDDADACIAGGAECKVVPMGLARMGLAGRLAETGDATDSARLFRPYHDGATGTLLGEGAGLLVLEEAGPAARRGTRVYAEVAGYGASQSSTHDYAEGDGDEGFRYAIENALEDAGVTAGQVDAVAPLACGVPCIDRAERGALAAVFGARLAGMPVIAVAPAVGDCMAGAGGLQAAAAARCVGDGTVPHPMAFGTSGNGLSPMGSPPPAPRVVLVCTGSLGGQNAALVLRKPR